MVQTCTRDDVAPPTTDSEVSQKKASIHTEDVIDEGTVDGSGNDGKKENGTILMPTETPHLTSLIDQPVNDHVPRTPLQQQARPSVAPQEQWIPVPESEGDKPPNLILLPPEIKLRIIFYVKDKRVWNMMKDEGPTIFEPSLRCLRMAHSSYRCLIPPKKFEAKTPYDKADMMLMAEDYYPFIIAKDMFPCYVCLDVLDSFKFDFNNTHGRQAIGEENAFNRVCKICWFRHLIFRMPMDGPKRIPIIMHMKRKDRGYGKHLLARFGSREVREANWQRQKEEHAAEGGPKDISAQELRQSLGLLEAS